MPDSFGFDHLPNWGKVSHRCIECGWPGEERHVSEFDRKVHHAQHLRERRKRAERRQREALAKARSMKRLAERENAKVEERAR